MQIRAAPEGEFIAGCEASRPQARQHYRHDQQCQSGVPSTIREEFTHVSI
jgi:hypothetical protein